MMIRYVIELFVTKVMSKCNEDDRQVVLYNEHIHIQKSMCSASTVLLFLYHGNLTHVVVVQLEHRVRDNLQLAVFLCQ